MKSITSHQCYHLKRNVDLAIAVVYDYKRIEREYIAYGYWSVYRDAKNMICEIDL